MSAIDWICKKISLESASGQLSAITISGQQVHREPTQSVCVADCYFIVNVLDLPFASPIAIFR